MIPHGLRIFLATGATDMRRSIDGLCRAASSFDAPLEGSLFVFVNRRRDRLKVLWHDGTGWCLLYKRLNQGRRVRPPTSDEEQLPIDAKTLTFLLDGVSHRPTRSEVRREAGEKVRSLLADDRYSSSWRRPQPS